MPPLVAVVVKAAAPAVITAVAGLFYTRHKSRKLQQGIERARIDAQNEARMHGNVFGNGNTKKTVGVVAAVAALAGTVAPILLAQLSPETYAIVVQVCSAILNAPPPEVDAPEYHINASAAEE